LKSIRDSVMTRTYWSGWRQEAPALLTLLLGWNSPATAHVMQAPYNLPVPLWLYAYGATAALLASFAVVGYLVRADAGSSAQTHLVITRHPLVRWLINPVAQRAVRSLSLGALVLTILSGFLGTTVAAQNFSITFFWIVFVLAFAYLTAVVGDVYRFINPILILCDGIETIKPRLFKGLIRYPQHFGYYPAVALYIVFIWIELFGQATPKELAIILSCYVLISLVAAWLVGRDAWFQYGDFLAIFFRLIGKLSPLEYRCPENRQGPEIILRPPSFGILTERPDHPSLLIFVLFMLSSTAYDGIHETVPWVGIFWKQIYPFLAKFIGVGQPGQYLILVEYYYYWQRLMMVISPFVYLAIYLGFVAMIRFFVRTPVDTSSLALRFAFTLIPIAFVYNLTHYFTLAILQGPAILPLLSDPLGLGWDLFGTSGWYDAPILLEAGTIWHTQVGLILVGHILSVYLSHLEALKIFSSRREAALSQLPMLILMVILTTIGLWILSLPIAAGQVLLPPVTGG